MEEKRVGNCVIIVMKSSMLDTYAYAKLFLLEGLKNEDEENGKDEV